MRKKFSSPLHKNSRLDLGAMKKPGSSDGLKPGRMHPAIHGRIRRSGCAPAEPYPPDRVGSETQIGLTVSSDLQLEPELI